jgi:hypothetical protein
LKLALPDMLSNSYFPVLAARELGCFRDEGLDLSLELMSPADKTYGALAAGEVDFAAAEAHTALAVFPRWRGIRLLCALSQGMYWFASCGGGGLVPRRSWTWGYDACSPMLASTWFATRWRSRLFPAGWR